MGSSLYERDAETDVDPDADPELTLALPEWLNATIERRRQVWTPVDTAAVLAFVLHLGLLAVVVGRGSLYLDDLRAQAATQRRSLAGLLIDPATGPLAPVPAFLDWLQADRYPLSHGPALLVTLLVRALLAVAFWRLLRRLLGPRPVVMVPFVLLLLSPALLPATTWYRPSITVLAATAASVWAVDAYVAWQLEGKPRSLVTLAVATVLACCCNLTGAAVPGLLLALQLTVLAGAGAGAGAGRAVRRRPGLRSAAPAIGLSGVLVAGFLAAYAAWSGTRVFPAGADADLVTLGWDALVRTVMPSLIGGPYSWTYPRPYAGTADPDSTIVVFAGIALLVGAGLALWQSSVRTLRALAFLAALTLGLTALVGLGRADAVGPLFTRTDQLAVVLVPFVLLAVALAAIPWPGGSRSGAGSAPEQALIERARLAGVDGPPVPTPGAGFEQPMTRRQLREQRTGSIPLVQSPSSPSTSPSTAAWAAEVGNPAGIEIGVTVIAAGLLVVAIVVGSLASTVTYTKAWWDNPTGAWLSTVQGYLAGAEAYPRIIATPLPESIFPAAESEIFPSSAPLLQLLDPDARFHDGDGQSRALNAAGALVPPLVTTLGQTRQSGLCVATIPAGETVSRWIRLTQDAAYVPGAQVEVGILVGVSGQVEVKVRTPQGRVLTPARYSDEDLPAGPHTLHFPVPSGQTVRSVQVTARVSTATCVSSVRVWGPTT